MDFVHKALTEINETISVSQSLDNHFTYDSSWRLWWVWCRHAAVWAIATTTSTASPGVVRWRRTVWMYMTIWTITSHHQNHHNSTT